MAAWAAEKKILAMIDGYGIPIIEYCRLKIEYLGPAYGGIKVTKVN